MRKIVANVFTSLDGVTEAPEKWAPGYFTDEMHAAIGALLGGADTMLLGRVTYETFAEAFTGDKQDDPVGVTMTATPKYVLSTTLQRADWANTTIVSADAAARIAGLKAGPGSNITVNGSISLVRWLLQQGLLDELDVMVFPLVLGSGARLFPEGTPELPLTLVRSEVFGNGVAHLTYTRQGEGGESTA